VRTVRSDDPPPCPARSHALITRAQRRNAPPRPPAPAPGHAPHCFVLSDRLLARLYGVENDVEREESRERRPAFSHISKTIRTILNILHNQTALPD